MIFDILTLFPEMLRVPLEHSIMGRAREAGLVTVRLIDVRTYAEGRHRVTDDYPYGGGPGMVMRPEPILRAVRDVRTNAPDARVILLTPQGTPLTQAIARRKARLAHICLVCGRYEGVDERIRDEMDDELSIGDYVLTGGEVAALVVVDVISRLIPGVLGDSESVTDDSFARGLLEYPQYTRPREYEGRQVPDVLLSGNHAAIERWRRRASLRRTLERRPDLLSAADLDDEDKAILAELQDFSKLR